MRRLIHTAALLTALLAPWAALAQAPPAVPALPDSERRTSYSLTASTCACNVNFALYSTGNDVDSWITVWVNGVRKLSTDPTFGWSLSSVTGSLSTIPRPITDAVLTFNVAQTGTVQIVGADRPRQLTQFTEGRGVAARDLNQRFTEDRAIEREVWDRTNDLTGRGLFFAPGNTTGPMPLPTVCANAFLAFDGTGLNPLCTTSGISGIAVPNFPVIHPVITNSGCAPNHSILWNDNNWCVYQDETSVVSVDPSALLTFTPTGTPTTGNLTFTFTFGSGACASPTGCAVVVPVTTGQSLTTVAANIVANIKATANLYNNVAGAQGQILAASSSAAAISLDFNSTVAMKVTFSDSASAITSNLPSACSTACNAALDTNPQFTFARNTGVAPVAGSQVGGFTWGGTTSGSPATVAVNYGSISVKVLNSTTGSLLGQVSIGAGNTAAADAILVGNGICTAAYVGSGGCGGVDTFTTGQLSAFTAQPAPTTGSGVTLNGGSLPTIIGENWGTSTALPISFGTAAGATPVLQSTNNVAPSGDTITVEGTHVILRGYLGSSLVNCGVNNVSSCSFIMAGSSSGTTTVVPTAAASGTLTLPAATDQIVARATADTLTNKTISGGSNTLSNIANASLTNSSITISGASVALGGSYAPARNQTLPSNPSGTTSSTPVMAGLSNGVTRFTPATSGNMLFTISGTAQNTNSGNGCVVIIRYGTGNGPANGAASTGTTAGATSGQQATSNSAGGNVPFSITAYATGLTVSTAYYYDLAFNAVTGGTCSLTNITMTAMEM